LPDAVELLPDRIEGLLTWNSDTIWAVSCI
jgi:hypothetical protein